jgi:hypothetical protein
MTAAIKFASLLLLLAIPGWVGAQTPLFESFDSYAFGDRIAASDPENWSTWNALPGTTEDAFITDTLSFSTPHSIRFFQVEGHPFTGGPTDVLLGLGNKIAGQYVLSWKMYVPTGKGAYIELLHGADVPSAAPAMVIAFPTWVDNDNIDLWAAGSKYDGHYPHDVWFTVTMGFDLDARIATLSINNTLIASWAFDTMPSGLASVNQLGAIRFLASSGSFLTLGEYYIDDISYMEGSVGIEEVKTIRITMAPNPTSGSALFSVDEPLPNALTPAPRSPRPQPLATRSR